MFTHVYLFCVMSGVHPPKYVVPAKEENQDTHSQQPSRSGSIPALLPKPPLTPLVKLVGKIYSLKCRSVYKVQNKNNHFLDNKSLCHNKYDAITVINDEH